jgi:hypothetical protein
MAKFWTKPRIVFFVWGVVEVIGWLATHYWPDPRVNWVWLALSVIGLIPMFMYMSLRVEKLRNILLLWVVVVALGMVASFGAFRWPWLSWLPTTLGGFWLLLMGAAFLVNAIWWTPRLFILGGVLQIAAGAAVYLAAALIPYQYIVAAVVGSGAMFLLMLPTKPRKKKVDSKAQV